VEYQREATVKRMQEIPGKGWKIYFDDHTGRYIQIGPGDDFHIQGDFIAVLPEYLVSGHNVLHYGQTLLNENNSMKPPKLHPVITEPSFVRKAAPARNRE
jgi:hypothetical protein